MDQELLKMFETLDGMRHDKTRYAAIVTMLAISGDKIVEYLDRTYNIMDKTLPLLERYPTPGINVEMYKKAMEFLKATQYKFLEVVD